MLTTTPRTCSRLLPPPQWGLFLLLSSNSVFPTLLPCTIAVGYDGIGFANFRRSKLSFFFAIVKFLVGL
ncbi:hypothetical protein L596_020362 [Steinernema carpocapsae]|uniref:Uncharacterized protein n=1 Tax=Steinernema carpocapsae TaxID=34508 RepID=A0A4U5MTH7_STECR|nr:hypothetical protein L596_020362 [Steinernema carpocapsae]